MASNVIIPLGLDKENLDQKLVFVIERHGSHACFMLSSLISLGLQSEAAILLLSLHHREKHYEKICSRLGINLTLEKQRGRFVGCYPDMHNAAGETMKTVLKRTFLKLKNDLETLKKLKNRVFLIVDDISDLLLVGCELRDVTIFAQSCRSLMGEGVTLVLGSHMSKEDKQQHILFEMFRRLSDIALEIHAFESMRTFNGALRIMRKKMQAGVVKISSDFHHFKITDNRIVLFSPGFTF
ncbi:elongator complex protein 6 [Nilaparvata lugens]|uniref:elongator complex protein 6 n=1 Tax=Nilaparvata lugens TaxID=108931 RepID=UPI00193EB59A|nr:elongator complex protein 6 [Nilaparvata lugens]